MMPMGAVLILMALGQMGGKTPGSEAQCGEVEGLDAHFRKAIVAKDVEAIIRMLPEKLPACDDEGYVRGDVLARLLRESTSRFRRAVFGGDDVRADPDLANMGVLHSLRELMNMPDLKVQEVVGRSAKPAVCLRYQGNGGKWWTEVCGVLDRGQWRISDWPAVCWV